MIAHQFIAGEPLRFDEEAFPRFLRSRGAAASIEYVADIAELEMAHDKARRAADARPVGAQAFAPLSIKRLKGLRVELHPSVSLVASRFPIVTIWENNRCDGEPGMIGDGARKPPWWRGRSSRSRSVGCFRAAMPSSAPYPKEDDCGGRRSGTGRHDISPR